MVAHGISDPHDTSSSTLGAAPPDAAVDPEVPYDGDGGGTLPPEEDPDTEFPPPGGDAGLDRPRTGDADGGGTLVPEDDPDTEFPPPGGIPDPEVPYDGDGGGTLEPEADPDIEFPPPDPSPRAGADAQLAFNGVDGASGRYLLPPMTPAQVLAVVRDRRRAVSRGVIAGVDADDLAQAGWGIVFAADADSAIREALAPLIAHRHAQAGPYGYCFAGEDGFQPGDSHRAFLRRQGAGPGPVDPAVVPYYLLLVGDAEAIPFRFQYQLDVQYAVGRLCLPTVDDYARYAERLVAAEREARRARRLALVGVGNDDDQATALSTRHLIAPLAEKLASAPAARGWRVERHLGPGATKAGVASLFTADAPALVLSASHGMGFPSGHPRQRADQGAILCQDWPGPQAWGRRPIPRDFYFAGDDVASGVDLSGMVFFQFGCFGGGTPQRDDFAHRTPGAIKAMAPQPFVAQLPQRLLAAGAAAAVGHVERAWGYSFLWRGVGSQVQVFQSTVAWLLEGRPIGSAMKFFNQRYAELATDLTALQQDLDYGEPVSAKELTALWTAHNDARSYVVLGDPAARLAV